MSSSKTKSTAQKGVKVTPGIALGIVIVGYLFINNFLIVQNDIFLGLLTLVNLALLTWIIFSLRKGMRAVVRENFVEDSIPYKWFNKNGVMQVTIALLAAFTFSVAFVVILKSLTLKHSFVVIAVAVFISGWVTGLFRSKSIERATHDAPMKDKESKKAVAKLFSLFTTVIVFTVVLAAVTSAKDTHIFFVNNAEFGNFSEIAYENAIKANGDNNLGRALVNLSLILEAFRQATINEFFMALGLEKDSAKYFWFFAFIFLFNFFKLVSFSAAFVLLTISARDHILDKVVRWLSQFLRYTKDKAMVASSQVQKRVQSAKEPKETSPESKEGE